MSSAQNTTSPRAPRASHPSSKSANQAQPNANGTRTQRRPRGNKAHHGGRASAQHNFSDASGHAPNPVLAESAVFSSEETSVSSGPRQSKKHARSQPSSDRLFSPTRMPAASLTDSEVPPQAIATPAKVQGAYAGATFQQSPAASALPMPKFLSRSVPANARQSPPTPPPEEGSDSGSSPTPSPSRAPIPIPPRHQDSPLDMLFKADRAEKAKHVTGSTPFASFSSPNIPLGGRPQHIKHDSFGSLNVPFPIELDANTKGSRTSPPAASPVAHRSVTAPSKIPQVESTAQMNDGSGAIQDLLNRLSISQTKAAASTPPKTEPRPTNASMRDHTPSPLHDGRSPFRSASGPTTPAPTAQDPDFFWGNRNLSPLFKAAKTDSEKRNSGLRTEITADSPVLAQGGFLPIGPANNDMRALMGNVLNGPDGSRRGSAPHIPQIPYTGPPNNRHTGSPGRRPYRSRPDSYPYGNTNGSPNPAPASTPPTIQKPASVMAFVPSSVRAKPHPPTPKKADSDGLALEQDLKRMLNLTIGNTNGAQ